MNYQLAKRLKDLGFPQKRNDKARYYINENTIAYFEDIKNAFQWNIWEESRKEEIVNWDENFVYIPELIDIIGVQNYERTLENAAYHYIDSHQDVEENIAKIAELAREKTK